MNSFRTSQLVAPDDIRTRFSAAMSAMYRAEVPAYGTLIEMVADINTSVLAQSPDLHDRLFVTDSLSRITEERHGAIRLGKPEELAIIRRIFAVMGMYPVGYYDLSQAGIPVHSTAFRPTNSKALSKNPFRVFTSLLRLDLVEDDNLRKTVADILDRRQIFTARAMQLLDIAETQSGLTEEECDEFLKEVVETFRWQNKSQVDVATYKRLHDAHRLVADVVSFPTAHINHLTPRTLDIDRVQDEMPQNGITPKAIVEGPCQRECPILLRQTSFKALEETVSFKSGNGTWQSGSHTARFGEIEARGCALTPKGRALYDKLLSQAQSKIRPAADGSNSSAYLACLKETFSEFPDDWNQIRKQDLGYFSYRLTDKGKLAAPFQNDLELWIEQGLVAFAPLVYEDFLPVSAAGIFQSNLGDNSAHKFAANPNKTMFERQLGCVVQDEFALYEQIEKSSIAACQAALTGEF